MVAEALRAVTHSAAAKTAEAMKHAAEDGEKVREGVAGDLAALRKEIHLEQQENTMLWLQGAESLEKVSTLDALREGERESSDLRVAELNSRIRMLTQENARLRQHQIDSNTQVETERAMYTATIAHLEAEFKKTTDQLRHAQNHNYRLQADLDQAHTRNEVAEDTMRSHLLARAMVDGARPPWEPRLEDLGSKPAEVAGSTMSAAAGGPYRDVGVLGVALEERSRALSPSSSQVYLGGEAGPSAGESARKEASARCQDSESWERAQWRAELPIHVAEGYYGAKVPLAEPVGRRTNIDWAARYANVGRSEPRHQSE